MSQIEVWRRRLLAVVTVVALTVVSGAALDFVIPHVHDDIVADI